jgi:uncharacterized membrane protein (UPF0127 family)
MSTQILKVKKGEEVVAEKVGLADTFRLRLLGLMFSKDLGDRDGLLIEPCNSIHTFFMNYKIDVVFLNRDNKVVKVFKNLKPWRMTRMYFSASKVLEMMGGSLMTELNPGDQLEIECIS